MKDEKKIETKKSITDELLDIAGEICDNYCRFMALYEKEMMRSDDAWDELEEKYCSKCPLNRI